MKKFLTLFLALCFTSVSLSAQESKAAKLGAADSVIYSTAFYFELNQGEWIEKYEYVKAGKLLKWVEANSSALLDIKGWADPSGTEEFNARLSRKRAKAIRSYLVQKGVDPSRITFEGKGIDFESESVKARRAAVVGYIKPTETELRPTETELRPTETELRPTETKQRPTEKKTEKEPEKAPTELSNSQPDSKILSNSQPEPTQEQAQAPTKTKKPFEWIYFTPRTNLLYWLGGMMNIGVEYKHPESNFGYLVNGGYSPLGDTEWNHNLGGWFVAPEVRYYFPSNEQWFVGAQFLAAGYNIKLSETGRQGTAIGGGVVGGYKLTLSDTFDMDFTLGVGYGSLTYDTYYHDEATETNPYICKDGTIASIIPIQAGVNLIWKIK